MSNNKPLISLLNKAAEKHYVPSLFSAGFPNSLSASCSSICTQILVSLFSSITNARTAALPGCSAGAKLWLLRLMMAGTIKVDEHQTSPIAADKKQQSRQNNSLGRPIQPLQRSTFHPGDGALTPWHKSGCSCPFNSLLPHNNFLFFLKN